MRLREFCGTRSCFVVLSCALGSICNGHPASEVDDGKSVVLGGAAGFQLFVGYTWLGNLLGVLDREEVPEMKKHLVWVGTRMEDG
jgi:hypothetical protein